MPKQMCQQNNDTNNVIIGAGCMSATEIPMRISTLYARIVTKFDATCYHGIIINVTQLHL